MKAPGGCNYFEGIVGITLVQYGNPLKATGTMEWDNSLSELGVSSVSVSREAIFRSETVYPMYSCPVFLS